LDKKKSGSIMTHQEQLALLKQGVDIWNQWWHEHRVVEPNLFRADLSGTDLSGVHFHRGRISGVNLSGATLKHAVLGADFSKSNLSHADLSGTFISGANLSNVNLSGANLSGANLAFANLFETNLHSADLRGAYLWQANVGRAELTGADLGGARFGMTTIADVDLRPVKGLEEVIHICPSHLSVDTILRSHGEIPEAFLRGVGLSDTVITAIGSLRQSLLPPLTCVLNYWPQDQEFASRLHEDLQQQGVRCWFNAQDRGIHRLGYYSLYTSMPHILILSRLSVPYQWKDEEEWVWQEVIDLMASEQWEKKQLLIPVRLDETIVEIQEQWAIDLRHSRPIADFTNWRDEVAYQQAFERLLREVKRGLSQ
jgi:hypothetical protein